MIRNIILLGFLVAIIIWVRAILTAGVLFTLKVQDGRIVASKGRIPPRMLSDIADIIERGGVSKATIRGVIRDERPVLLFRGELSPDTQQQMRNVVGQFNATQIRGSKKR
ncbi:MAG: DUF3634 family protein [Polyangiaceae bacterium]|nr:DUF3634 family protein [Polyangiaceae bacterium]